MGQWLVLSLGVIALNAAVGGLFYVLWLGVRLIVPDESFAVALAFFPALAAVLYGLHRAIAPRLGKRSGEVSPGRHHQS